MSRVTCFVGVLHADLAIPTLRLGGRSMPDFFAEASRADRPQPAIELVLDDSRLLKAVGPSRSVSALDLHAATKTIVGKETQSRRLDEITLLFAGSYGPFPKALGIMWDRGFRTDDDGAAEDEAYAVPRQGCAVFLDAIAGIRSPAELGDEVSYTTAHELGHVFNLVHGGAGRSFMATSRASGVRPPAFHGFTVRQQRWLSRQDTSSAVWPGGAEFLDGVGTNRFDQSTAEGFRLEIELSRSDVWGIEPLELDVTLSSDSATTVPDELDPGYAGFSIWIEGPDGTVRRYRSPRHYCGRGGRRRVSPDEPFRRDISVFGQSGGYTFPRPGAYRIRAQFDLGRRGIVVSNQTELDVRAPLARYREYRRLEAALGSAAGARLLYYRRGDPVGPAVRAMTELCESRPRAPASGTALYALGRGYLDASRRAPDRLVRDALRHVAAETLRRAAQHPHVGSHAREKADALAATL